MLRLMIAALHLCVSLLGVMHLPQALASAGKASDGWVEICTGVGMQLVRVDGGTGLAGALALDSADGEPLHIPQAFPPYCPLCTAATHLIALPVEGLPASLHAGVYTTAGHPSVPDETGLEPWSHGRPFSRGPPSFL